MYTKRYVTNHRSRWVITHLDDLCHCYFDLCGDHLVPPPDIKRHSAAMCCNLGQIPRVQLDLCETHANWSHLRSSHAQQFDFVHLHRVTTGSLGRVVQVRNIFWGFILYKSRRRFDTHRRRSSSRKS